ncbi:MAG: hypothetical protein H6730_02780 [Deltaproteobacteria bacterium]|nr:hypothetical protein [Deltaproteobacteria bacterium]
MSLRDKLRSQRTFDVDDQVKKVLAKWSKERSTEGGGLKNLERAVKKLNGPQRALLVERMAEISLGLLFVMETQEARAAAAAEAEAEE